MMFTERTPRFLRARKNWRKALIKIRALRLFRHFQGNSITQTKDLANFFTPLNVNNDASFDRRQARLSVRVIDGQSVVSNYNVEPNQEIDAQDMDRFAMVERFFKYVERGTPVDVENIQKMIDLDPKKYTRMDDDPERLMNSLNKQNESAIYVATRNNNLNVVKALLKNKANPYHVVTQDNGVNETAIDVATRWKCKDTLRYLLENVKWTEKQLKQAKDLALNDDFRNLINSFRVKKKKSFFGCFSGD